MADFSSFGGIARVASSSDILTGLPITNAKISLLDPSTREVLTTDIYTDASGWYDVEVDLDFTDVEESVEQNPSRYWMSDPHPNPVSFTV